MQPAQYTLASFSSAGPTYEGFVKPEVVAMGGHIVAYAPDNGTLAQEFPQWVDPVPRLHHVGHVAGDGGGQRCRRPDAAGEPVRSRPMT